MKWKREVICNCACLVFKCFSLLGSHCRLQAGRTCSEEDPCSACHLALTRWSPLVYLNSGGNDFSFVCSRFAVEVSSACRLSSASISGPSSQHRGPPDAHSPFCLEAGSWALVGLMLYLLHIKREHLLLLAKLKILGQIERPPNLIEPLNVYFFYLENHY